jgi:hypothetical protein
MAPEMVLKMVVLDLFQEGEQLFAVRDSATFTEEFLVKWCSVQPPPAGYQPIGGGVAFVPEDVPVTRDAKVTLRCTRRSCRYKEEADMLVLVLPPGRTLTWYQRPNDAKEFEGRLAVYWLRASLGQPIDVVWNLVAMEKDARTTAENLQDFLDDESGEVPIISIDRYERYDVAMSYASEDRELAVAIAQALDGEGKRVFLDHHDRSSLMSRRLGPELDAIFSKRSTMCVLLASERCVGKKWTQVELEAALEAAERMPGYIVPIQLDDTRIPGLPADVAYLPIGLGIDTICENIVRKLDRS